jgi:hypothetical protein
MERRLPRRLDALVVVQDDSPTRPDQFTDLADIEKLIGRDPSTRPVREPGARNTRERPAPVTSPTALDYPGEEDDR